MAPDGPSGMTFCRIEHVWPLQIRDEDNIFIFLDCIQWGRSWKKCCCLSFLPNKLISKWVEAPRGTWFSSFTFYFPLFGLSPAHIYFLHSFIHSFCSKMKEWPTARARCSSRTQGLLHGCRAHSARRWS